MIDIKAMNAKQRKAFKNINNAAADYIYGLENGCLDSEKGSQQYNDYYNQIKDLDALMDIVYSEALHTVYDRGGVLGGKAAKAYLNDIKFCGKEFLLEVVRDRCTKFQADVLNDLK